MDVTINYKDFNRRLLLEKETWTFYLLAFSCIRNNLHIVCKRKKKPHNVISTAHSRVLG